jgi:ubiquinone/menaquinone biosynthesis C-methylase UbiE
VPYRLAKLTRHGIVRGPWLDCGCADGGYTVALAAAGASSVVGVDPADDRIRVARARRHPASVSFECASAERLPYPDGSFEGVLLNEVLEHVTDEHRTLTEIRRVLRPGGHLALFSPNRWFPFEGHGARIGRRWSLDVPVPLLPWMPARVTRRVMRARNYWSRQLVDLVSRRGFEIVAVSWVFPQFEAFPWLPAAVVERFRELIPDLERTPVLRRLGVSTFVLARRPPRLLPTRSSGVIKAANPAR